MTIPAPTLTRNSGPITSFVYAQLSHSSKCTTADPRRPNTRSTSIRTLAITCPFLPTHTTTTTWHTWLVHPVDRVAWPRRAALLRAPVGPRGSSAPSMTTHEPRTSHPPRCLVP